MVTPQHAWIRDLLGRSKKLDPRLSITRGSRMRLTVAQALIRFLWGQYSERDGVSSA